MTPNPEPTQSDVEYDEKDLDLPVYYEPGMVLDPASRKFAPTNTRGWLFHDAGEQVNEILRPFRRGHVSRWSRGRIKSKAMRKVVNESVRSEHWDNETISQVTRWFAVNQLGFKLRSYKDVSEKQMDDILKAGTAIMLHPSLNRGDAHGRLQFRMSNGNYFVAEWNPEKKWFDLSSGAVVVVMREGAAPWRPSYR